MPQPILYVFSGLPGVGKSTIAKALAARTGAIWLRIDSIEKGIEDGELGITDLKGAGYWAAQNVAHDNLAFGHSIVADAVNPFALTRDSWADISQETGALLCEIEVYCPDKNVHRARVEARTVSNNWAAVEARRFDPWPRPVLRLNSEELRVDEAVSAILKAVKGEAAPV
ncbi:MAG: AAA family ATPase [Pseudomonadota bacterium]